jgi:hypothetical protein
MNKALELIYKQIVAPWAGAMNVTITPLFYEGDSVGSELSGYDINKLYLCERLDISTNDFLPYNSQSYVRLHNQLNVAFDAIGLNTSYWDTTAAQPRHIGQSVLNKQNFYFSRIVMTAYYNRLCFYGYRITRA